jgi:hypothetical protein
MGIGLNLFLSVLSPSFPFCHPSVPSFPGCTSRWGRTDHERHEYKNRNLYMDQTGRYSLLGIMFTGGQMRYHVNIIESVNNKHLMGKRPDVIRATYARTYARTYAHTRHAVLMYAHDDRPGSTRLSSWEKKDQC